MKSSTENLIAAMRVLARDIDGDGVANAAIAEAADRLAELHADHLRDATKMAELEAQAAIGRRAVEMLKDLEMSRPVIDANGFSGRGCLKCCGVRALGHKPGCELAAILRDAEQAKSSNGQGILNSSAPEPAAVATDPEKPVITNAMKAACMGEFSVAIEVAEVDEDGDATGEVITQTRDIPWDTVKAIYKAMYREAIKSGALTVVKPEPSTVAVDAGALEALLAASDAVIERWHTPLWKYARPTAEYIAALRVAADDARRLLAGVGEPATAAVDAGALAELREAMTKLRKPMSRPEYAVARARIVEAAWRLLQGVSDGC